MKNLRIVLCAHAMLTATLGAAVATDQSHTFLRPRPLSNNNAVELSLSNYHLYHNNYDDKVYASPKHRSKMSVQVTDVTQHTHSPQLGNHFLWNGKSELSIREDGTGDIGSVWLGLITPERTYNSSLSLVPWRNVVASVFNYHQDLSALTEGVWFSLLLPIADVRHGISFEEWVQGPFGVACNTYGDPLNSAVAALNSRDMIFGKVTYRRRSKSGLGDTQLKVGYNLYESENSHLGVYGDVLLPTAGSPNAEYLFEPLLGNGGHVGIGVGFNLDLPIASNEKEQWSFQSDAKLRYLLCATERRSFDLKNRPWSRYLLVAHEDDPSTPLDGINRFTRDMVVKPGATIDWWSAVHYAHADFNLELSWNAFWRDKEEVRLKRPWKENIAIFDIAGDARGYAISASKATISQADYGRNSAPSDRYFTPVTKNDLDLQSAAMPSICTSTISLGFSFNTMLFESPTLIGLVFSTECSSRSHLLCTSQAMFKLALSF